MKSERPTKSTELRLGLTLVIVIIVISSPIVIFTNPVLTAKGNNIDTSGQHSGFSLADRSTLPQMSPTNISPLDSGFTTQAALISPSSKQTNNIVNTQSEFAVTFTTATAGVIKKILVTFPAGTNIGSINLLITREGIGPGTAEKTSSTTITYIVDSAVSVPAGRLIKLEFGTIVNAPNPGNQFVTVSTRDAANTIIDGPTAIGYSLKQIGTADIANNAVTTPKIADDAVTAQKIVDGAFVPLLNTRGGNSISVAPGETINGVAPCLANERPVSGAASIGDHHLIIVGEALGPSGYRITMFNSDPTNSHSFVPLANCMRVWP